MPIDASIYGAFMPRVVTAQERLAAEAAQRMQEQQLAQRNQLMALQLQEAQAAMQDRAASRAEAAAKAAAQRNALAALASPEMVASQNALAGGGGPTMANAGRMRPVDPRASALYTLMQAGVVEPKEYLATLDPNYGRQKVKQFLETTGPDGRPVNVGVTEYGDTVGKPMPKPVEMKMLDLGGAQQVYDPYNLKPGQQFTRTMTPEGRDASARGWVQVDIARKKEARDAAEAQLPKFDASANAWVDPRARTVTPVPGQASNKPLTEGQAKAVLFGNRARNADEILSKVESDTGVTQPGFIKRAAETTGQIVGLGTSFGDVLGGTLGSAVNWTQSSAQQKVEQAQRDFINAVLRRESGAVISEGEFDNARKQYFPQPGEGKEVREQKRKARELAIAGILAEAPEGRRDLKLPARNVTVDY